MQTPWWSNWDLSYSTDAYGPIYGGHSVQEAVYNTLEKWLSSYIMETNRQLGGEILKIVTEYRHRPEYRTLPKEVDCAILVIVPGTAAVPIRFQNTIRSNWKVEVNVFIYGTKDWQETQALTSAYASVIRSCLVQHGDLGGFSETTKWTSENYYEGEHQGTRTTGLAKMTFEVTVGNTVTPVGGAPIAGYAPTGAVTDPSLLPLPDAPIATEVNTIIEKIPT